MKATPIGSQITINSLHYKIGVLGKPFYFNDDEWILSTTFTAKKLRRAIKEFSKQQNIRLKSSAASFKKAQEGRERSKEKRRHMNAHIILKLIREYRQNPLTSAELSKITGISKLQVSRCLQNYKGSKIKKCKKRKCSVLGRDTLTWGTVK